jgi:ubiquitin carboxyl-terminal hydrolase 5/13
LITPITTTPEFISNKLSVSIGPADVAQDDLVEDPYLAEHLSHWGIDVMKMEKTEKSMAELTVELNKTFEFDKITEAGADLAPLSGPGYVGLKNLGNSCYLNSVMQVLHTLPEIQQRYANRASQIFQAAPAGAELVSDFVVQMAKLGVGLTTDRYCDSAPAEGDKTSSLEPRTFKTLVGRGHSEFSSNRQQDACEYLQHLLEVMTKAERAASTSDSELPSTSSLFKFQYEDRIQCIESGKVTYKTRSDNMLGLMIPMEAATNKFEVEQFQERESKRQKLKEAGAEAYIHSGPELAAGGAGTLTAADEDHPPVKPIVPFQACLHKFIADEMVEDFYSSALRRKAVASKAVRMRTFPPYLAVQMRRYFVGPDWTPKKLDVLVQVPETLSLEALRGKGMQEGELPLPEEEGGGGGGGERGGGGGGGESTVAPALAQVPNEEIVMQLVGMGFSENGSKRASLATGNTSAEASMEWVFSHMEDPDFNDPLPPPAPVAAAAPVSGTAAAEQVADPESVAMLTSMGFTAVQVIFFSVVVSVASSLLFTYYYILILVPDLHKFTEPVCTLPYSTVVYRTCLYSSVLYCCLLNLSVLFRTLLLFTEPVCTLPYLTVVY